MSARKPKTIDLGKDDATRADLVGQLRREDFKEFWNKWENEIQNKGCQDSPVKLYAMFQVYYRTKILEALPELAGTDGDGFRRPEHQLNALLHRVMPGYNQFVEIWLENYDPEPTQSKLQDEDAATRARARESKEIELEQRRNKGSLEPEGGP